MSSMSMTSRRQIWSNQHPIRKQRSLIDNSSSTYLSSSILNGNFIRSDQRSRYSILQKQYSVDQLFNNHHNDKNNTTKRSTFNKSSNISDDNSDCGIIISGNNRSNSQSLTRHGRYNVSKFHHKKTSDVLNNFNCNSYQEKRPTSLTNHDSSSDFGIFLASKKKTFPKEHNTDLKKDKNIVTIIDHHSNRSIQKSSKTGDDKVNLNIFLGQTATQHDDETSDVDSSIETPIVIESQAKPKTPENKINLNQQNVQFVAINKPTIRKPLSAASRRAQFQASHDHSIHNSLINSNNNNNISASPSLTIERRAPLVRAMSAPIRQLDDNSKNILANKRKSRRRKLLTRTGGTCEKPSVNIGGGTNQLIETDNFTKSNKKSLDRNSTLGCDVVTLVSLISSEDGSDSEKEEILPHTKESPIKRAPTLRKTGKSVSFQENDLTNFSSVTRDFPHMLRRGSVAPLAARIRANRPPTAPPVSIYLTDFEHSNTKMSEKFKSASKEELSTKMHKNSTSEENSDNIIGTDQYQYPDYVRSIKERECWKLFQKMCNKGVLITYDTILRGMLTPTELRQLLKQKEIQEAQKQKEDSQELLITTKK